MTGFFKVPVPRNEPVLDYAPGSKERKALKEAIARLRSEVRDIPMYIGGREVRTDRKKPFMPPHDKNAVVAYYHEGDASHVRAAIDAALAAKSAWAELPWEQRASIFLKAAELLAGPYRAEICAATIVGQSKNVFQAEIDAACEMIDFLRFNVAYMAEIYGQQPLSSQGVWNRVEQRPLEGFVFALTPFNFTAIAGNLPTAPAMMGNTVVWKPANTQIYSAYVLMKVFREAGLPDGVINLMYVDGATAGEVIFSHREFAGIHFTGSTGVFQTIWKQIGENIQTYRSYPRIVGETGGKDFVIAHESADPKALAVGLVRGAFEYQGQKCSAASRAYIPENLWDEVKGYMLEDLKGLKPGSPEDFGNFFNAVIDERSFDKITSYLKNVREAGSEAELVVGGGFDKSEGYFIEPTILLTKNPYYVTMCEELFGPVLTVHVYKPEKFEEILDIADRTSPYALTGAVFAQDRYALATAMKKLTNAAGNFYINDKPTGAVVGQQPFGGSRSSGTNDKAGSMINLLRWVSPRTIKETFVPPRDYRYPFLEKE